MTDLLERLKAALADRYTIERELGRGGMAVVYLAQDQKLGRHVALKVLRPELAASLGSERFLREIAIAAKLTHSNILALHDCGEADGQLYYTMPFVEGESLRDRLSREKQLSIEDALQITREVADGLGYAHSLGLVHRDIKPENILFQGGHALVADFGIARAVSEAGAATLTETGLAVGTPAYMSPEQASGSKDVDARSDLYSLGCVLYEMLSGETPYLGNTPQAIVAKKLTEPAPRVSVVRDKVPPAVEAALDKALSRTAADRFATAEQFSAALSAELATAERPAPRVPRLRQLAIGGVALVVAAVGVWAVAVRPSASNEADPTAIPIDPTAIAVLPFQVIGADSASPARTLARFMGDLFQLKVTGEFGRTIRHTGSVAARWRETGGTLDSAISEEAELAVARAVGAGRLVRGTVVAHGDSIVVSASLVDVESGRVRVTPQPVAGTIAQQQDLVDQLIVLLLARDAGYSAEAAPRLRHYEPEAIQAWLAGHRSSLFSGEQKRYYRTALARDSSLVSAALSIFTMGEDWQADSVEARYAWDHQDQLSEPERAYLRALAGSRFGVIRTMQEEVAAWEQVTRQWPEFRGAQVELGANLGIWGALASVPNWRDRSRTLLEESQTTGAYTLWFLIDDAFQDRDTARARELTDRFMASLGTTGWFAARARAYEWRLALLTGDATAADSGFAALEEHGFVVGMALADGRGIDAVDRLLTEGRCRSPGPSLCPSLTWLWGWARGNERQWRSGWQSVQGGLRSSPSRADAVLPVFESLFLGMPEDSLVLDAVRRLELTVTGDVTPKPTADQRAFAVAWVALWKLMHGATAGAAEAIAYLETQTVHPYRFTGWVHMIDVLRTRLQGGDVRGALLRMDSVVSALPLPTGLEEWRPWPVEVQNLFLARMLAQYGEPERALAAARRRAYHSSWVDYYTSIPEYLREEGRLAATVGDTAGAIKAYNHYLALREDPDPPWRAEWEQVRAELAALVAR